MNRPADPMISRGWKRFAAVGLLVALAALVLLRGVVPALTAVGPDFPNYLTAARIVAERGSVERVYDDSWFQEQMRRELPGLDVHSKFSPFPPPTALLLLPLAGLSPLAALRVTTIVSLVCLLGSIALLARIAPLRLLDSGVLVLLAGYAICNSLRLGQPYIEVSAACILGYYAWLRHRPLLAGVCFGLFVPIKYYPVFTIGYFALRGQWRVVLGGATAILAVSVISVAVLGWRVHQIFLSSVLANHLVGNLSMQDPFTAAFQSFDTLFRRLFVFDAMANPRPWLAVAALQPVAVAVAKLTILAVAITTLVRQARIDSGNNAAVSVGLLGIVMLLIAPATASYHFVLLWLPVGLLVGQFLCQQAPAYAWLLMCLYSLISFFPYGHAARFEGDGGLTVLAYPRLFLLLVMFAVSVRFIWTRTQPPSTVSEVEKMNPDSVETADAAAAETQYVRRTLAGAEYVQCITTSQADQRARSAFQDLVLSVAPPGGALFDFGVGAGIDARFFAERGFTVRGYDIDPRMREFCADYCRDFIATGRVGLDGGSYREFLNRAGMERFDLVVSNFAPLNLVDDLPQLFAKFQAMTGGRGTVIASVLNPFFIGDLRSRTGWRTALQVWRKGHLFRPGPQAPHHLRWLGNFRDLSHPHFRLARVFRGLPSRGQARSRGVDVSRSARAWLHVADSRYMFLLFDKGNPRQAATLRPEPG